MVLRENAPGVYRIDTTGRGHDDRVISLALVAQHLASQGSGTLRLQLPEGRFLSAPIKRRGHITRGEPAVALVRTGEPRPTDRLVQFRYAKKHPNYRPPGPTKLQDP